MENIKTILEYNNCIFNNESYRQNSGTAMGIIFAPTYATLTIGYLEVQFYNTGELK